MKRSAVFATVLIVCLALCMTGLILSAIAVLRSTTFPFVKALVVLVTAGACKWNITTMHKLATEVWYAYGRECWYWLLATLIIGVGRVIAFIDFGVLKLSGGCVRLRWVPSYCEWIGRITRNDVFGLSLMVILCFQVCVTMRTAQCEGRVNGYIN